MLVLPLPEDSVVTTRTMLDSKAIVTLPTEAEAKQLLADMRSTKYMYLGQPLYANRMLEPEQALLGWRLRTIKRALQGTLSLSGQEVVVCYRSSTSLCKEGWRASSAMGNGTLHRIGPTPLTRLSFGRAPVAWVTPFHWLPGNIVPYFWVRNRFTAALWQRLCHNLSMFGP